MRSYHTLFGSLLLAFLTWGLAPQVFAADVTIFAAASHAHALSR